MLSGRRRGDMTVYEDIESLEGWEYPDESVDESSDTSECECEECSGCGGRVGVADEVTAVPSGTRPPIRPTATLRNAWREDRCATNRMVTVRLFGRWNTPVNPKTVDAWRALEKTLTAAGYDVHRAWVYVCRNIAGQKGASLHAYGLAIDIDHAGPKCNVNNPTPNRRLVRFSTGATKLERCRDVQRGKADTAFTPEQVAAVEAIRTVDGHQVFAWGGRWPTTKDTMHFQINVTPTELGRGIAPETVGRVSATSDSSEYDYFDTEAWTDHFDEFDSEWDEFGGDGPFSPEATSEETWDTIGTVLGGLAGGLVGGPIGAVAGGLAGRAWGAAADRPGATAVAPAPTPTPTPITPSPTPSPPSVQPDTRPAGAVAVPAECVAIPPLVTPPSACPVGTETPASRPLRMPSPGIGRFEGNPVITAFAADLAHCFATRKGKTDPERARLATQKADELAKDYAATLTAGLVRYGATWKKRTQNAVQKREKELRSRNRGQLAAADLTALERMRCEQEVWLAGRMNWLRTGWMVGRREQVDFETLMPSVPGLANFAPPPLAPGAKPTLVATAPEGTGTPITQEVKAFLVELRRRTSGFDANNYPGHGGGKFSGRGFSLDLTLRDPLDSRGFYPRDKAAAFLLHVDAAARATGLRWRVLYNDYAVAAHINRLKRARHVVFIGSAGSNLNWHGPLVLHFHLDLAPTSGAASNEIDGAAFEDTPLDSLEQQLLGQVQASWQRANLTPPNGAQLGQMRAGKKGYKRYISNGMFVDDIAVALRRRRLLSISDDDIDMLQRASNVETGGRLTALNSWDSAFMSVGFMQWTLKYRKLQQWIALAPQAFRRYGIELEPTRKYTFSPKHAERAIVGAARPADLRSREWGLRFYMASLDLDAVVVEYRRALEVSNEVRRSIVDPHGAAVVAHYNSSPVLRALVQETHNNRPAYMKQAMKNVASKANTDTSTFLNLIRNEIVRVYTARENAPGKAANLIKKTQSRRLGGH